MSQIKQKIASDIQYMNTTAAYDLWSDVYDTDGNFLQALDNIEMRTLLPAMLEKIKAPHPWRIVDLGCGTGRNTLALLSLPDTTVVGLDASSKMLEVARSRLQTASQNSNVNTALHLQTFDLLQSSAPPALALNADAVVSTLVIEHIPANIFFRQVAGLLKPGGVLLLTNMHSEMGGISQAGFIDENTGMKIRPTSYAHTIQEVQAEARANGFELVSSLKERSVTEDLIEHLGTRSKKWLGVTVWFGGMFRKV